MSFSDGFGILKFLVSNLINGGFDHTYGSIVHIILFLLAIFYRWFIYSVYSNLLLIYIAFFVNLLLIVHL